MKTQIQDGVIKLWKNSWKLFQHKFTLIFKISNYKVIIQTPLEYIILHSDWCIKPFGFNLSWFWISYQLEFSVMWTSHYYSAKLSCNARFSWNLNQGNFVEPHRLFTWRSYSPFSIWVRSWYHLWEINHCNLVFII